MKFAWGIPCRGGRIDHEDKLSETVSEVAYAVSQTKRIHSASTASSSGSFDHQVFPQSPLERLMDPTTDSQVFSDPGYCSASSPSQTASSDSASQSSSSNSVPVVNLSCRRKRFGRKLSFRRAVTPGEVDDLKADGNSKRCSSASPVDRVAKRRAAVKQLIEGAIEGGSETSGTAAERRRIALAAFSGAASRFPIVSSRHWFHIMVEDRDLDGGAGLCSKQRNFRLGLEEGDRPRCASVTESRSPLRSCLAGTRPGSKADGSLQARPQSAPLKRTAAVSFDDSALQIRCVTPDTDTSSCSEPCADDDDEWIDVRPARTQSLADLSSSARQQARQLDARLGGSAHATDSARFHCPVSTDEITNKQKQLQTDGRSVSPRLFFRPPTSQGLVSKCEVRAHCVGTLSQRGDFEQRANAIRPQRAVDFNSRIVDRPRSLPCKAFPPGAKRQDGGVSSEAQVRQRPFSSSESGCKVACPDLTTLLTSNQERQLKRTPMHDDVGLANVLIPDMSLNLVAVERFHAGELSQISVAPGDRLRAENHCLSRLNGGWVWCYSPSCNKLGYVPARCVEKYDTQVQITVL